jgi:hypothetical protein
MGFASEVGTDYLIDQNEILGEAPDFSNLLNTELTVSQTVLSPMH